MQKRGFDIKKEILIRICNNDTFCIRKISKETGIAEQHLKKAIDSLEEKHILRRVKGKGKALNIILNKKQKEFILEVLRNF